MRLLALVASCLPLTAPTAFADLSWEYVDERNNQAKEVLEHKPAIEAIVEKQSTATQPQNLEPLQPLQPAPEKTDTGPAEKDPYAVLAEALDQHPEMASVNEVETKAATDYRDAVASGNPVAVSITSQALARAKAQRYQKAMSIPELRLAVETWQKATIDTEATEEESSAAQAALETIQTKLKALSEAIAAEYSE